MQRVFIETTIPSFYYETRTDRRSQDWRAQTRLWWDRYRHDYELTTSDFVIAEFLASPSGKSARAGMFFQGIKRLPIEQSVVRAIRFYVDNFAMPADATGDAAHLAMASVHDADYLLTWNCQHLANANKARHIRTLNDRLGLKSPIITTPFELVPES